MNNLHFYVPSSSFRPFSTSFSIRRNVPWWGQILDPGGPILAKWNYIILVACLIALLLDPLYLFLPSASEEGTCMIIDKTLGHIVTVFRCLADCFFYMHIVLKFRTAFVAPNSRVFGRGELVTDPKAIAIRYLKSSFVIDIAAALPLAQIVVWSIMKTSKTVSSINHKLSMITFIQYVPRFILIFPIQRRINKTTGVVAKTPWLGAAYNIFLCLLGSHLVGSTWYSFALSRLYRCWKDQCTMEMNTTRSPSCAPSFFDCSSLEIPERKFWFQTTLVFARCDTQSEGIDFGMFVDAFTNGVFEASFLDKYFYCLWWGLKNVSSYGQNLVISGKNTAEALLCMLIATLGLGLFSHLVGNMQTYLQSTTARLEEWRVKRKDTEEWMRHRQLPPDLQDSVRRFVQYKWIATRGVNEEAILNALPLDLRRAIKRHLCLALVRRVPFFAQMDDPLLDAICERLVSSLHTNHMCLLREGAPVNQMLFIIRGKLESSTTNGGRAGFYNSITLGPGDFCGEELLTWALIPGSSVSHSNLPLSTRTVKSLTKVEAFALWAKDLKYVAKQFKRLHSKKLQHAFRYYSHQWRTWGSCFIQTAWRRYKRKKMAMELARQENLSYMQDYHGAEYDQEGDEGAGTSADNANNSPHLGATILASKFAKNTRRIGQKITRMDPDDSALKMPKMFKPTEPDFSAD